MLRWTEILLLHITSGLRRSITTASLRRPGEVEKLVCSIWNSVLKHFVRNTMEITLYFSFLMRIIFMTYRMISSQLFVVLTFLALAFVAAIPMANAAGVTAETAPIQTEISELKAGTTLLFAKKKSFGKFKTNPRRTKKKCNGLSTSACCEGISYCGCLYMPGSSDDNHPTSCTSSPPPSPGNG